MKKLINTLKKSTVGNDLKISGSKGKLFYVLNIENVLVSQVFKNKKHSSESWATRKKLLYTFIHTYYIIRLRRRLGLLKRLL